MKKQNLIDLWKISKTTPEPLLGDPTKLATLDFMAEYVQNYDKLDRNLIAEKGFFFPLWNNQYEDTADDILSQFQEDCFNFLWKNKESYTRMFELLSAEYEPLWNYDKTSNITDTESGTNTDTTNIGARHSEDSFAQKQDTNAYGATSHSDVYGAVSYSDVFGARNDSTIHGAQSETDTIGAVSNSDVKGARHSTSENEIAGFNSNAYSDSDKTTSDENSVTDTHTEQQRTNGHSTTQYTDQNNVGSQTNSHTETSKTDTHSDLAHTDTFTQGAHKDEHDQNAAQDSTSHLFGHKNTHEERTTGNIGVMSTQDLMNQEKDFWNNFRFYDIIFNDITKNLCSYFDGGYECF